MEQQKQGILPKNFSVNEKYSVMLFIKQGSNAETYRVKGKDGKLYLLKLFNYSKLHRSAFDSDFNTYNWKDKNKARQLVDQGLQFATAGNTSSIRQILIQLIALMPDDEKPKDTLG